jgi:bifunctional DNase/RNase
MNASLTKVVVTEIADKTFYAEIHVETTEGIKTIKSRPSDAIALAVRMSSPIYAEEEVLASAGHQVHEENNDSEEDVLAEFRDFLDDVSPEDFSP